MTLQLRIPRSETREASTYIVADLAEASRIYSIARDGSHEGASTWPEGGVYREGQQIARVSYNGRVWDMGPAFEGALLYDNRTEG